MVWGTFVSNYHTSGSTGTTHSHVYTLLHSHFWALPGTPHTPYYNARATDSARQSARCTVCHSGSTVNVPHTAHGQMQPNPHKEIRRLATSHAAHNDMLQKVQARCMANGPAPMRLVHASRTEMNTRTRGLAGGALQSFRGW